MAKKQEETQAFPENYAQVRAKIIDGTITRQELSTLYDHYAAIKGFTQKAEGITGLINDLHQSEPKITTEKYHGLASKLVEVEKAKVMEAVPVNEKEPDKELANKSKRTAEFFRNTSLAKLVVLDESKRNNFCRDIYEDIAAGRNKVAKKKLSNLEVPDFLKDHYSSIKEFYKENGKEIGAARNMVFHIVSTSITAFATENGRSEDVPKTAKGLLEEVYGRGNDPKLQPLIDKISDRTESVQKKGFIEWFVEKVQNLFAKKEVATVEKTAVVSQEQNVSTARKRSEEVIERPELVGPALKPKELQQGRKRANAIDKAQAEEIGKMAKNVHPKPKLEGQRTQVKQQGQSGGMIGH